MFVQLLLLILKMWLIYISCVLNTVSYFMFSLYIYMCTKYVPVACGLQSIRTLTLELQKIEAIKYILGIKPEFSARTKSALNHWVISPVHIVNVFKFKK